MPRSGPPMVELATYGSGLLHLVRSLATYTSSSPLTVVDPAFFLTIATSVRPNLTSVGPELAAAVGPDFVAAGRARAREREREIHNIIIFVAPEQ